MKASDDLYRLVKSLTKSEKRYFKLHATLYGGNKLYLELFDAIDSLAGYDEALVKKQFMGMPVVRQFNVAKRYLYEQIMCSLRAYHAETTVSARIRLHLHDMEILCERGLLDQARKSAGHAMALAREHEHHPAMLEVLEWKETLNPGMIETDEGVDEIYDEVNAVIDIYRDLSDHSIAARKLAVPFLPGALRSENLVEELRRRMEGHPGNAGAMLSVKAGVLDCWSRATFHHATGDDAEALRYTKMQMELFESHPGLMRSQAIWYFGTAANYLMLLKRNGKIEEFWSLVARVRECAQTFIGNKRLASVRLQAKLFTTLYFNMLTLALGLNDRERFRPLALEVEQGLRRLEPYLSRDLVLHFRNNLALLYFELGEYERALEFNNAIINGPEPLRGRQSYIHARLMNVVIHYELGHHDLLEYLIRSNYRYLRSRRLVHRFEAIVLDLFRSLLRIRNRSELLELFVATHERLAPLEHDPLERDAFRHFQYLYWLDRRIASLRDALPRETSPRESGRSRAAA